MESNSVKRAKLINTLNIIDKMIIQSTKDKTIDVRDLRKERNNCAIAIKKLK